MRKILFTLLAILSLSFLSMNARTFVLSVGIGHESSGMDLPNAANDARDFKTLMEQHSKDVTIMTSSNATRAAILGKLKEIAAAATENDRIYFYMASHGGPGCVVAYDDLITYEEIVQILNKSKSPMCVCFIDSCHSGSSKVSVGNALAAQGKNNIAFLTGCRAEESSIDQDLIGHGFMTKALLKGLRGKSDANTDRRITLKELFKYVYNDVAKRSGGRQHPQLIAPVKIQDAAVVVWKDEVPPVAG